MLEEISFINPEDKSVTNTIKLEGINILVGPNNSGKTFLLKNLYDYFKTPHSSTITHLTESGNYFKAKVSYRNKKVQQLIHKKILEHLQALKIEKKTNNEFIKLIRYDSSSFDRTQIYLLSNNIIEKKLTYQELIRIYNLILNPAELDYAKTLINRFRIKFNNILEKNRNKNNNSEHESFDALFTNVVEEIKESPTGRDCISDMVESRKEEINSRIKKFILKLIKRKIIKNPIKYVNQLIKHNVINIIPYYTELEAILIKGKVIDFATFLKPAKMGDENSFVWKLFLDDVLLNEFKKIIKEMLGIHLVIDVSNLQQVILRTLNSENSGNTFEKSISNEAITFFKDKKSFYDNASDGILSLAGLLLFLLYYKNTKKIILLDEPDAFLHPPLAKKLGKFISTFSKKNKIQFFISTHSSSIIDGCLQNKKSLNVIRLTYFNEQPKYYSLDKDILFEMVKDPSLRSNSIISSIFYNSVILCEGDSDRKLYSEINEKLSESNSINKIENVFYLKPIIKMGLPIAIITDLDIICEGNRLKTIFDSLELSDLWKNYSGQKDFAFTSFEKLVKEKADVNLYIQEKGLYNLEEKNQKEVINFLKQLAYKGIFLVPVGTLESWFLKYNISIDHTNEKSKREWLTSIFDLFAKNSIPVETDDIWEFMIDVNKYLSEKVFMVKN